MEFFDITDTETRKVLLAVNEADQNKVLVSLTSKLYDNVVDRIDDIDFVKTALLNFIYEQEHEIRVKPNAKIALDNFSYDEYTVNFKTPLIVSGTYFGNNGKFTGDYAKVDDGFGNNEYIDRQGNITSKDVASKRILDKINYQLKHCNYLEEVFKGVCYDYVNGIDIVRYDFL